MACPQGPQAVPRPTTKLTQDNYRGESAGPLAYRWTNETAVVKRSTPAERLFCSCSPVRCKLMPVQKRTVPGPGRLLLGPNSPRVPAYIQVGRVGIRL